MHFKIVGGADVPDWLLSQTFVVARISAVKVKVLAKLVLQHARGEEVQNAKLVKLLHDKFDEYEIKGVIAALHFILVSSAKYDVCEEVLALELQQLGLPKEHTEALVGALRDGRLPLQTYFAKISLRMPKVDALRWRAREDASAAYAHALELCLSICDSTPAAALSATATPLRALGLHVDADTLALVLAELRAAREAIDGIGHKDASAHSS